MKRVYEGELRLYKVKWEGLYICIGDADLEKELLSMFSDCVDVRDGMSSTYRCDSVRITIERGLNAKHN